MKLLVLLVCQWSLVQSAPTTDVPTTGPPHSGQTCGNTALLEDIKKVIFSTSPALRYLGDLPAYPASSCQQLAELKPSTESGLYWIQEGSGPVRVFCQMEGREFGQDGVWMRVAGVNMTVVNSQCPSGLELITSPKRLCRRKNSGAGCSSVTFDLHNIPYSRVCGRVIGYQYYTTNAFKPFYDDQRLTIDGVYVDGVSLTYGSTPRQHIWTFAAAYDETPGQNLHSCHCTNSEAHVAFTGVIPPFIGDDYFCETGSRVSAQNQWYLDDPLWDGEGCGRFSSCCDRDNKPWFCKELPASTTDDIELRVCFDGTRSNDEDAALEIIELYVQ